MTKYAYEKLYLLKGVFINLFRDRKSNDAPVRSHVILNVNES
jgi:hypothetical protein